MRVNGNEWNLNGHHTILHYIVYKNFKPSQNWHDRKKYSLNFNISQFSFTSGINWTQHPLFFLSNRNVYLPESSRFVISFVRSWSQGILLHLCMSARREAQKLTKHFRLLINSFSWTLIFCFDFILLVSTIIP